MYDMKTYPNSITSVCGYYGIGIYMSKSTKNIGTIWRTAHIMGADFIFTIGQRYETMKTDTMKSFRHIPLFFYRTVDDFFNSIPKGAEVIGIELDSSSVPLTSFSHPQRAVYLLGSEDTGLPADVIQRCHSVIQLPGSYSLNVSVAGSVVMYDRYLKSI